MSAINFDTDAAIQRLRRQGLSEEAAREFVQVLKDSQAELVTKTDLEVGLRGLEKDLKIWAQRALAGWAAVIIAAMAALKVFA